MSEAEADVREASPQTPSPQSPASGESDGALIEAAANGDGTALGCLYDRHGSLMLGVAFRILGNRRDAEDLLHDVFVEAWAKAGSYDPARATVRSWLLVRVRSRAIDRLRSLEVARRHGMAPAPGEPAEPRADDTDPGRHVDRVRARDALAGLSAEQRDVVEKSYFAGLTCREIAELSQIPIGTVKSRLFAAMAQLRRSLGPTGRDR